MLEFFTIAYLANNANKRKEKEDKRIFKEGMTIESEVNMSALNFVSGIISLIIGIMTAKLAYECNPKADQMTRIVMMIFGFFFSGIYLIYYFFAYMLKNKKC